MNLAAFDCLYNASSDALDFIQHLNESKAGLIKPEAIERGIGGLRVVGVGKSRTVYDIGDRRVLKVANPCTHTYNNQNAPELAAYLWFDEMRASRIIPKVYAYDSRELKWMICESATTSRRKFAGAFLRVTKTCHKRYVEHHGERPVRANRKPYVFEEVVEGVLAHTKALVASHGLPVDARGLIDVEGLVESEYAPFLFDAGIRSLAYDCIRHGVAINDLCDKNLGVGFDGRLKIVDTGLLSTF